MAVRIPQSEPLTVDDIYDPPDDGHRYELIDGCLIVTPSPGLEHQVASVNLLDLVRAVLPAQLRVLHAPFDWIISQDTKVQPDLLVFRRGDVPPRSGALRVPPLLAVELLSPSTRRFDLGTKKLAMAAGGAEHYWVIDPLAPSITAFDLVEGEFVEVGTAAGDDELRLTLPFPITVVPSRLLD